MLEKDNHRTELSQVGEFGLIRHIAESVELKNSESVLGIGDDAAIINNRSLHTVVSTDLLVEGVHFDLAYVPLKHLGYKSVVVNLSDIYAMNAQPKQIVVGLAVSNRFSLEAIDELYAGIKLACDVYNVDLVGGDTTAAPSGMTISITAIGNAPKEKIVGRSGAKEDDLICVSGDLGSAYVGLQLLNREKSVFQGNPDMQPDFAGNEYVLERQLKPEARKDIIQLLDDLKIVPTAMIDISDGLASDLLHICEQSNKGCQIYEEKLPIDPQTYQLAMDFNLHPAMCALNGGEDYELLFTVPLSEFDRIKSEKEIKIIGHITDVNVGTNLVDSSQTSIPLQAQGWDGLSEE
ncbi:MAG: thiamine-phosphate kinase [Bacteroidia bacterium]|nr:thiamine-phosphate kinase [Bacteroidia bacterium]